MSATSLILFFFFKYLSDDSPWRDDDDNNDHGKNPGCLPHVSKQSEIRKDGDAVRRNTKLGAIEGKIVETTLGGLVSKAGNYSVMIVLLILAQITF